MSPVADWNLADFLDRGSISPDDRSLLRTFYGCLAVALRYLHENCIRHKDIKPQVCIVNKSLLYNL
jgi:serine/threonine protein kinase